MKVSKTRIDAAQQHMQGLLERLVEEGQERGIQFAAYLDGVPIVNAWAGIADPATGRRVEKDTLFAAFSTGKGITATAVHLLVARGILDYDRPIAAYWPEFGCRGKAAITLRQALSHTAGIPQLPPFASFAELCDWDFMCRRTAELEPLWPPGSRTCYHAISFSWIIGETVRRADGRSIAEVIEEEICRPLGISGELYIGIPATATARVAVLETAAGEEWKPDDPIVDLTIPPAVRPLEYFMNRDDIRRACIPASNGIMTARAIACHYGSLVGNDGRPGLLPPEILQQATTLNAPAGIAFADLPNKFGLGYGLSGSEACPGMIFGHGGYGGSAAGQLDRRHNLAIGLVRNRTLGKTADITGELYRVLGLENA